MQSALGELSSFVTKRLGWKKLAMAGAWATTLHVIVSKSFPQEKATRILFSISGLSLGLSQLCLYYLYDQLHERVQTLEFAVNGPRPCCISADFSAVEEDTAATATEADGVSMDKEGVQNLSSPKLVNTAATAGAAPPSSSLPETRVESRPTTPDNGDPVFIP